MVFTAQKDTLIKTLKLLGIKDRKVLKGTKLYSDRSLPPGMTKYSKQKYFLTDIVQTSYFTTTYCSINVQDNITRTLTKTSA